RRPGGGAAHRGVRAASCRPWRELGTHHRAHVGRTAWFPRRGFVLSGQGRPGQLHDVGGGRARAPWHHRERRSSADHRHRLGHIRGRGPARDEPGALPHRPGLRRGGRHRVPRVRSRRADHRERDPAPLTACGTGIHGSPWDNRIDMGTVEEVRIAKRTGFCYGVREAIDMAKEASAAGKTTHTLGQVVHNEGVITDLERLGIQTVDTLDDVDHGAAVVIRAHGVRPDVMERANARGLEVIDGTCTWVIQEQKEIVKLVDEGYTIVLLGTPRHPEVVGLLGFAPDAIVVDEEEDWDKIPRRKKMALISQSTQPPWKFEKLAAYMVSRSHELKIVNTVCPVTIRRQEDTLETAREVDLMVVVGGRSSANTKELTRLCGIVGTPAMQIEGVSDLEDPAAFDEAEVVGVTGGT